MKATSLKRKKTVFYKGALALHITAALLFSACAGGTKNRPATIDGISVEVCSREKILYKSLAFLKGHEPLSYKCLNRFVKQVGYSIIPERSYPFYDTIYVAPEALARGPVYSSSVIVHELLHIIFYNIRKGTRPEDIPCLKSLLARHDLTLSQIKNFSPREEEVTVLNLQLKFLLKHGTPEDAAYQRLKIRERKKMQR